MFRALTLLAIAAGMMALATGAPAQDGCPGDCSADRQVTVDELVTLVNIALGNVAVTECTAGDTSGDGEVTVDELQAAINAALGGCNEPLPTATIPPGNRIRIDLSSTNGTAGGQVTIQASLFNAFPETAATSNDIVYDRTLLQVVRVDGNRPDCTIDPRIGPGTAADKMLTLSILAGAGNQEIVRIGLFGINNEPVSDGPLFSCKFVITAGVTPQTIVLGNIPGAAVMDGYDILNSSCVAPAEPLPCCTGAGAGSCIVEGGDGTVTVLP